MLLKTNFNEELTRIMLKYEIPENEAEYYISNFIILFYTN